MVLQAPALFFGLGVNRLGSTLVILHQKDSVSRWIKLRTAGTPSMHKPIITRRQRITGMEASHIRAARGQRSHSAGLIPDPVRSRRGSSAQKPHESNTLVVSPTSPHIELLSKGPDQAEQRAGGLLQ